MLRFRILTIFLAMQAAPLVAQISGLADLRQMAEAGDLPNSKVEFVQRLDSVMKSNYVLFHKSQSLQKASPLAPRVVSYHPSTRLIAAFGALHTVHETATVELMQFDAESSSFNFAEVHFTDVGPEVTFNPESCKSCHSKSLHPNWASYPLWPGLYGSRDNATPTSAIETEFFPRFADSAPNDPLYGWLANLDTYFANAPGVAFNDFLNPMSQTFIPAQLKQLQHYEVYNFALQGAFHCSRDIETFLPDDLRDAHFHKSFEDVLAETADDIGGAFERRFLTYVENNDGEVGTYPYYRPTNFLMQGHYRIIVAALRYLLDQQQPQAHRLFFAVDRSSFQTPWVTGLYGVRLKAQSRSSCRELATASREALAGWQRFTTPHPSWL